MISALWTIGSCPLLGCARNVEAPASPLDQRYLAGPMDPAVNLALGERAEQMGDLLRAEQYFRRVEELPAADATLKRKAGRHLISVLVRAHRYQEAQERCRQRLTEMPGDRPARFLLAAIFVALDRARGAERELEELRRTGPDDPLVYLELGRLYRDFLGDRARADLMLRRYLALAPGGSEADAVRFDLEARDAEARSTEAPRP